MKSKLIQSRSNHHYKSLKGLKPGFDENLILVEGLKLATEALKAGLEPLQYWSDGDIPLDVSCLKFKISPSMYKAVSPTRSGNPPLGVFQRPKLGCAKPEQLRKGRYLLLDRVQEPGNAGALIRGAAAFGFDGVLWVRPCVFPYHHGCIRASAGNVFHIPQYLVEEDALDEHVNLIGAAADGSSDLTSYPWPENLILAMGNEGQGLSPRLVDRLKSTVKIPIAPGVESLNVAGAAHILMYHLRK